MELSKVNIHRLELKSPPLDPRGGRILTPAGEIAQIVSGPAFKYLAYLEFKADPTISRGHHYHRVKEEFLYVIQGRLRAIYEDLDSHERQEAMLAAGDLVQVRPGCAHVYFSLEYTQAVEYSATPFDPADTYKHFINP